MSLNVHFSLLIWDAFSHYFLIESFGQFSFSGASTMCIFFYGILYVLHILFFFILYSFLPLVGYFPMISLSLIFFLLNIKPVFEVSHEFLVHFCLFQIENLYCSF